MATVLLRFLGRDLHSQISFLITVDRCLLSLSLRLLEMLVLKRRQGNVKVNIILSSLSLRWSILLSMRDASRLEAWIICEKLYLCLCVCVELFRYIYIHTCIRARKMFIFLGLLSEFSCLNFLKFGNEIKCYHQVVRIARLVFLRERMKGNVMVSSRFKDAILQLK